MFHEVGSATKSNVAPLNPIPNYRRLNEFIAHRFLVGSKQFLKSRSTRPTMTSDAEEPMVQLINLYDFKSFLTAFRADFAR